MANSNSNTTFSNFIADSAAKQERFSITSIVFERGRLLSKTGRLIGRDNPNFAILRKQFEHSTDLLRRLRSAAKAGKGHRASKLSLMYARSFSTRVVATVTVTAGREGSKLTPEMLDLKLLEKKANQIDFSKGIKGSAKVVTQNKSSGNKRLVLAPCSYLRASDQIICEVLNATGQRSLLEYNRAGKGRTKAALKVKKLIENGYRYWLIFDLKNCYPSIGLNHLQSTNMPKEMLMTGVFWNSYIHLEHIPDAKAESAVRQGLPQGATASGILAGSFIEGQIAPLLGDDLEGLSCVDDVAIGARSLAGLEKVAKAIEDRFTDHNAGPLTFKHFGIYDVREGMSFLNYRFFHSGDIYPDCMVFPDRAAKNNFRSKIFRILDDLEGEGFETKASRVKAYVDNWITGHSAWQPSSEEVDALHIEAMVLINDHGTISSVKHEPLFKAFP